MPKNAVLLTKVEFSIFFFCLLSRCFGKNFKGAEYSKEKLFGYNRSIDELNSIRGQIKVAIGKEVNTRGLSKAVSDYHRAATSDRVELSAAILNPCLKFLRAKNIGELVERYFKQNQLDPEAYEVPSTLIDYSDTEDTHKGYTASIDKKLKKLANTTWHYYTHYYSGYKNGGYPPKMLRLSFQIFNQIAGGNYEVELSQQPPFTTFTGMIVRQFSGDNILVCELTSKGKSVAKRLYLNIHVDLSCEGSMFVGTFMRYTDGASIYAGSFVLEKITEPNATHREPKIFRFFSEADQQPNTVIQRFLYDRTANLIQLPTGLYNKTDFTAHLNNRESALKNPMPDIDLYVTAPVRGFARTVGALAESDQKWSPDQVEELRSQIIAMVEDLKSRNAGFDTVWYSLADPNLWNKDNLDPNYLLDAQLENFRKSKRILIILPFPSVTSTYLEAGWMMMNTYSKPVYICYSGREDLPFLLQKVNNKRPWIQMRSLKKLGGIQGIPDWIINNKYHEL